MSLSTSAFSEKRLTPARVRLARERRGLSKVALASVLGVTTRVLQTYEIEGAPRSRASVLAQTLGVTESFFDRPEIELVSGDQAFFRARRRATAYQLTAARAAGAIGIELYEWIAERFKLPEVVVPDLDRQDPETAAATVRAMWGQGTGPVPNLVQLSEAHGVRVLSLPIGADTVDAFSLWRNDRPYVFLSMAKTAERSRFDLAHEIGHLVMHSRGPASPHSEREADAFASAFLMPRGAVLSRSGREPATPEILRLRSFFRVSAMAMTRRLHDVGRLSDWAYRQNCVQLTQRGFRSGEPDGMSREHSHVFREVFRALRPSGSSEMTSTLGILPEELHALTFGQAAVSINGHDGGRAAQRPTLSLVQGG